MNKTVYLHWSYSPVSGDLAVTPKGLEQHQIKPVRSRTPNTHIGGLGLQTQLFTRAISPTGHLFTLQPEQDEIHICIIGGVSTEFRMVNTMTMAQKLALSNELKSLKHFGITDIRIGDFANFDLPLWMKAIGI